MNLKIHIETIKHKAAKYLAIPVAAFSLAIVSFSAAGAMPKGIAKVGVTGESPSSIKSGTGDQFAMTQASITLPLEDNTQRAESFKSSFHANVTEFDWRGADAAAGDYLWLSMPMHYQQNRSSRSQFIIQAEPGLMTDGTEIGLDSIGINGSVMGRILWANGGYWQYGLMIDRAFGDYDVRPVLGVAFQADHKTWVELGFPKISVTHNFSTDIVSYLTIKPAGGVWKETVDVKAADAGDDAAGDGDAGDDADAGADADADADADTAAVATGPTEMHLRYRSWQFGIGANFHWRESLWLNAEIGQLRNRRITAGDSSGAKIKATPTENVYWRVGASLKF